MRRSPNRLKESLPFLLIGAVVIGPLLLWIVTNLNECNLTSKQYEEFCVLWNTFRAFAIAQNDLIKLFLTTSFGGLIGAMFKWAVDKLFSKPSNSQPIIEARFPFQSLSVSQLGKKIADSSPWRQVPYIQRDDPEKAMDWASFKDKRRVLIVGVPGSGKTTEALELIKQIDVPEDSVLVIRPDNKIIEDTFRFPIDIEFQQRTVILFLDGLQVYKTSNGEGLYTLLDSATDFERILNRVLNSIKEQCDDFWVIATIRSGTEEWRRLNRRPDSYIKREFELHELPRHSWSEAERYCIALDDQLTNIDLDFTVRKALADRYDGTFASIRDYLHILDDEARKEGIRPRLLTVDDVRAFSGIYPKDWEQKFYLPLVRNNAPAEAIFKALSIASQVHIYPYADVILRLSSLILDKGSQWERESQCRNVIEDISPWVMCRDGILSVPEIYVENKADWKSLINQITDTLLFFYQDSEYKYRIFPSLLNLARLSSNVLNDHQRALKLAECAHKIEPKDPRVLHTLAITWDKLGNLNQAIRFCRDTLQVSQNEYVPAFATLGVSLSKQGKADEALEILQQGKRLFPRDARILVPLGIALDCEKTRGEAIENLQIAIESEPENIAALVSLGITLQRAGRAGESIKYLEKALTLQPDNESIYRTVLRLFQDLEEVARNKFLNKILDLSHKYEGDLWTHRMLCKFFWRMGKEEAANAQLDKAMSLELETADELWAVGELLYDLENYQSAIAFFDRAIEKDETHYKALSGLGRVYNSIGENVRAVHYFRDAIKFDSNGTFAWAGLGNALYQLGKINEAKDALLQSVRLDKENSFAWVALGKVLQLKQQPELVEEVKKTAVDGNNPYAWISLAIIQQQEGQKELSSESFGKGKQLAGDDPFFWINLSEILNEFQLLDETLAAQREAVRLMPNNALAHSYLASTYLKLRRIEEASQTIAKAVKLLPSPSILINQGFIALQVNDMELAFSCFNQVIGQVPQSGSGWSGLAQTLNKQGKLEESYDAFQKSVNYGQRDPTTLTGLGMTANDLGKLDIAENALRASISLRRNHSLTWRKLGEVLVKCERILEAIDAFQKALEQDPDGPAKSALDSIKALEVLNFAERRAPDAKQKCDEIAATQPSDPNVWCILSSAYRHLQEFEFAISAASEAINIDSNFAPGWYTRARAYEEMQDYREARKHLDKALLINPNHPKAPKMDKRLKDLGY